MLKPGWLSVNCGRGRGARRGRGYGHPARKAHISARLARRIEKSCYRRDLAAAFSCRPAAEVFETGSEIKKAAITDGLKKGITPQLLWVVSE